MTGVADLTEAELHALQLLAEKQAGASVAFINIASARTLSDLGLASRSQEGWDITAAGGAELARRGAFSRRGEPEATPTLIGVGPAISRADPSIPHTTDLAAYFARIGYSGPRDASLGTLQALHELHPAAIAFEAIDCLLDRGVDISPAAVDAKLIHGRRGGYCFEQNSLFARVLGELGFQVEGLAARVRWSMPPDAPAQPRTHHVLRVTVEGEPWLVDVGFGGCVLTAPLKFQAGLEQPTPHDTYRLTVVGEDLRLEVLREPGWVPAYDVSLSPCEPRDYEMANWFTSTHPTSHFRANLLAGLTTAEARYGLLFNRFTTRPVGGEPTREILDADGIERTLREVFKLEVEPSWRPAIERAAAMPAE